MISQLHSGPVDHMVMAGAPPNLVFLTHRSRVKIYSYLSSDCMNEHRSFFGLKVPIDVL